jgi:hypothetical protein
MMGANGQGESRQAMRASWGQRIGAFYHEHQFALALVLVYGVSRLLASLFTVMAFSNYGPTLWLSSDIGRYAWSGAYPFFDYWMEYPPMYPWLTVLAHTLSTLIPRWEVVSVLWTGTMLRWVFVPFEVGSLLLVYQIARLLDAEESSAENPAGELHRMGLHASTASPLLYVATFAVGYVPLGWFDILPLFWLLLGVYLALRGRPVATGIAIGLGLLSKPIPVLVLPMAWQRLSGWRARVKLLLATGLATILPLIPFLLRAPHLLLAHFQNLLSRSSYETVWALLDGYRSYGVVAEMNQRFDPALATWVSHAGQVLYSPWSTLAFGALALFLWTRRVDWGNARRALAFVGLTWALFILWVRGYSPPWAITFIPFVALLMPNLRGALYLVLFSVAIVAEWPVAFTLLGSRPWHMVAVILWRTALCALMAGEYALIVFADARPLWRRLRLLPSIGLALLVLSGIVAGYRAAGDYAAAQLAGEPLRTTISALRQQATPDTGLICRDSAVCERMKPYLSGLDVFWLEQPSGWQAERLPTFAARHTDLWLVEEFDKQAGYDLSVETWLSTRYGKASQVWIDVARVSRFVALDTTEGQPSAAVFGGNLRLSGYAVATKGRYANLALTWQADGALPAAYKVFVHVRDAAGNLLGQNDQEPGGGFAQTNTWTVGATVHDLHGVILARDLPTGAVLSVGLYDPVTGQRLALTAPSELAGRDALEIPVR